MKRNLVNVRWHMAMAAAAMVVIAAIGMKTSVRANAPAANLPAKMSQADLVKRGDYLVNSMGCGDCHTPMKMGPEGPEYDMDRFLSGHSADEKLPPPPAPSGPWIVSVSASGTAWSGPWGVSYTQNLTPDPETGVSGTYTEEQFIMTIREGKKQGRGRAILPPMPWQVIRNLTDDDLKAIFAYLKTVKPVRNKVPEPVIAEMK